MIKAKFGDQLEESLKRLLPFLFRRRLNPDLMTLVGALICLVAGLWAVVAQVRVEERMLESRYGAAYEAYASQTPRWLLK